MKYKLTNIQKTINGITLHQIQALKNFGNVKKGDVGGWLETEDNLTHEGNAWVSDDAQVFGDAVVSGNAWVSGNAVVCGNAQVSGDETPTPNPDLPDILSALPKEVTSITISGKTYKLETKWVLQD